MGIYIKKEELDALRKKYPQGCRVELVKMDDPYREMTPGLKGVVESVDDTGSIHVHWQNGSSLAVIYGEDLCHKIEDNEEVTIKEIFQQYITSGKSFHLMTPAGFVDLTNHDAIEILKGAMKVKGHPGNIEYAMEITVRELLEFRCKRTEVYDKEGEISALVY